MGRKYGHGAVCMWTKVLDLARFIASFAAGSQKKRNSSRQVAGVVLTPFVHSQLKNLVRNSSAMSACHPTACVPLEAQVPHFRTFERVTSVILQRLVHCSVFNFGNGYLRGSGVFFSFGTPLSL